MPRSGWLAVGAVVTALGVEAAGLRVMAGALALGGAVVVALLGASAARPRRRLIGPAAAVLVAGAALALRVALLPEAPIDAIALPTDRGPWPGVVATPGSPRDGQQSATIRIEVSGGELTVAGTLPRYPIVVPGQHVLVSGSIQARPDSPYGTYLERIGVAGTLRTSSLELAPGPIAPVLALETARRAAADLLARVLPEPEAGLAAGILIGLRDRVDREVAADFTTAGVSHVVAISGWNIAIVAAAVATLGGALGRRRRSILTMLAIVVYVVFAGGSPSVVRAAAMAGVVLLARESGRAGRAAAALGWAVTLLLLADPSLIGDAGFQLSSAATAGLITWATPVGDQIGRLAGGRVPRWLAESLGVSLAAQAATLPIVLETFGRLALIAPAANLFIVPVVPIAMAAGLVAFVGGLLVTLGMPAGVGSALALPGWLSLTIIVAIARLAADIPFASATLLAPWNVVSAIGAAIGLVLLERRRRTRRPVARTATTSAQAPMASARAAPSRRIPRMTPATRLAVGALVGALVLTGAVVVERPTGRTTVTVLDVGQGDAILVEGARGGRLLVDGGPDPERLLVELDRLLPPWDRRIDAVVLTHPHEDHVAGLAMLLARYDVERTFEPGMRGPGPGYLAWRDGLTTDDRPHGTLGAGDRIAVDDIRLDVLWPERGAVPVDPPDTGTGINNVSIVLLGTVAGRQFLLTGDIEEEIDRELLDRVGRVDLLKIAHHGSRTASTEAFLDAVRPAIAVASAGTGNRYGHPAPATLGRLRDRGAHVFRTDLDGSVTVTFDRASVTVRSTGGRPHESVRRTLTSRAADRGVTAALKPGFLCAVPTPGIASAAERRASRAEAPAPRRSLRVADADLYHRADDGSGAGRGRQPAALARSTGLARPALARGRRGGRVSRPAGRGSGDRHRPPARRERGPAPRHRQDARAGRSPPLAGARSWLRGVARRQGSRSTRAGSRRSPRGPAAGRGLVRGLASDVAS